MDDSGQVSGHPAASGFVSVSAGTMHSCAIEGSGNVECWGSDEYGQSSVPGNGGFVAIGIDDNYTCGLRSDNMTGWWGRFEAVDGGSVLPTPTSDPSPTPVPGNLGTRSNPVPLGQNFRQAGSPWEIRVDAVDNDAWPEIQAERDSNPPLAAAIATC